MANYLGRAGAYALHKKYPTGSQTAAQIAAERANLAKARAAKGESRHTSSATYHGIVKSSAKSRGTSAVIKMYNMRDIQLQKQRTVGVRYMSYHKKAHLKKPTITGKPKKFRSNISPGRFYGRTAWGKGGHGGGFKRRLQKRSHRFKGVKKWKRHGHRYTPR